MSYRAIVFDMDGTILDTLEDLRDALNYALEKNDCPLRTLEEVRRFVGNGIQVLVERGVPEGSAPELTARVLADFKQYYAENCGVHTRPYAGVTDLVRRLRDEGYHTAVVSNKADFAVQELCELYFRGLFETAIGDRVGMRRKPAPDGVNLALATLGVSAEEAVYVGDSEVDAETARNTHLNFIGVAWGFRGEELLRSLGTEVIARDMQELYLAITGNSD